MSRPKGSKNKYPSGLRPRAEYQPIKRKDLEISSIKLTLKSMGRIFRSEAPTFEEAVDKIKISGGARSTSVLKVETGDKEIVKILNARYNNGIFWQGSPTMKFIYLKGVRAILGV